MSQSMPDDEITTDRFLTTAAIVLLLVLVGFGVAILILAAQTPLGGLAAQFVNALFGVSSGHALWYVTRAAGLTAYLLLWLSTVWGLAVSSKIFDYMLHRSVTYDFHQFLSLLSIGFVVLHVVVLTADHFLPFSVAEILVPFLSTYRPLWVGIGIIGFYLTLLVTVTFYLRRWIGIKAFRVIHLVSFVAYFGAALHGLLAGTDTALGATKLMYAGTFLVIVFLTVHWLVIALASRAPSTARTDNQLTKAF